MSSPLRSRLIRTFTWTTFTIIYVLLLLGPVLHQVRAPEWLQAVAWEVTAVCRDASTQWMVVVCLLSYLVALLVLERRFTGGGWGRASLATESGRSVWRWLAQMMQAPNFWLGTFVVLVLVRYFASYKSAATGPTVVILLAGIVLGKFTAALTRWRPGALPLWILTLFLAASAYWGPKGASGIQYRDQSRWTGLWGHPNFFGLLTGVGLVLAVGLFVQTLKIQVANRRASRQSAAREATACRWQSRLGLHAQSLFAFAAAVLCGIGLLKSYSRGAWLGTALALAWFGFQQLKSHATGGRTDGLPGWWRRNRWPALTLLLSLLVISFWQFRHTETPMVRRVFSVGNINDFSWRNRVTTWVGALKMIQDRPWAGHGWNEFRPLYAEQYKPERLEGSGALGLNDYLTLALAAGIPAVICLVIGLVQVLVRAGKARAEPNGVSDPRAIGYAQISAAGLWVLAVGFFFDDGLFRLSLSLVFWLLWEQARLMPASAAVAATNLDATASTPPPAALRSPSVTGRSQRRGSRILRGCAGATFFGALGLTGLHLFTTQFPTSERTLALARRFLLQPEERADFEFLAAQPIWAGQKLNHLLTHVQLAHYTRGLVNWKLDEPLYREFVLSPEIVRPAAAGHEAATGLNWRRELWEYFYPRIRKANTLDEATTMITVRLERRMKSGATSTGAAPRPLTEIWRHPEQPLTSDESALLTVAAFRSAGIPARLNSTSAVEYWDGERWNESKKPAVADAD